MNERAIVHHLKILPKYYKEVVNNNKHFELRKDDRDYRVGDFIVLQEYANGEYTGEQTDMIKIKYILKNCPTYGLKNGFCIIGW